MGSLCSPFACSRCIFWFNLTDENSIHVHASNKTARFLNARDSLWNANLALKTLNVVNLTYLTFVLVVGGHELLCVIGGGGGVEVGTQRGSCVDSRNKT